MSGSTSPVDHSPIISKNSVFSESVWFGGRTRITVKIQFSVWFGGTRITVSQSGLEGTRITVQIQFSVSQSGLGGLELQSKSWPARPMLQKKIETGKSSWLNCVFCHFLESQKKDMLFSRNRRTSLFFFYFSGVPIIILKTFSWSEYDYNHSLILYDFFLEIEFLIEWRLYIQIFFFKKKISM